MATVTDFDGSQNSVSDDISVQFTEDSNINVFEFGNLILADILPSVRWIINQINDFTGNSVSETDYSGSSVLVEDKSGSSSSVVDFSGS